MRLIRSNIKNLYLGALCSLTLCVTQAILAQTTNFIPSNVFPTDNGFLFSYKQSGEKVVSINKIREAEHLPECHPAEDDPDGHWGLATNGFQLSLRFKKMTFTNGEPLVAIMFIRNITNNSLSYFRPSYVIARKDGNILKRKDETGLMEITALPITTIFPQTQNKYLENLDKSYDLSENGNYIFQATCAHSAVFSQPVVIVITNGIK